MKIIREADSGILVVIKFMCKKKGGITIQDQSPERSPPNPRDENGIFNYPHNVPKTFSIQRKFWLEISEIPRAQLNCTFWLHKPDPNDRTLGYCSCQQDTKGRYWGQQFCQMEGDISVQPTKVSGLVKVEHPQSWSRMFRLDQTDIFCSIWCTNTQ